MFKVFPCNKDKEPLVKDWANQATDDPGTIRLWQELFRDRLAFWGAPTGRVNGIIALDLDVKPDRSGFKSIEENHLEIPPTLCQDTINGGRHYIYRHPMNGKDYGNRVNMFPGVDRRGDGGYVCLYNLDQTPIAPAPKWFLSDPVRKPLEGQGEAAGVSPVIAESMITTAIEAISNAAEGERNHTLNQHGFIVAKLVAGGTITYDYAVKRLKEAAEKSGLPEREIEKTIQSAMQGGHSKPITSPFGKPDVSLLPPAPIANETAAVSWVPGYFTLNDLLDTTKLRKPQLFENWSTEDIHITTADGGTGKTTLKLYESICLALGERFLGFPCLSPGKTLYITGEDTEKKLAAMIGRIAKDMGVLDDQNKLNTILSSIVVKKDSDLCIVDKTKQNFYIPNNTAFEILKVAIDEIKPRMIIFDPISSFWGSEAALNDMAKAVIRFMMRVQEYSGACVEMINHAGKVSSQSKDMSQFAGRGGTGLPSHARVNRVMRPIFDEEYMELTGKMLEENESCIMCNVAKFTDGSPLFNKPFLIMRRGYLFERVELKPKTQREAENNVSDIERVFKYIEECRAQNKYPTHTVITAAFNQMGAEKISEKRVKQAIGMLQFSGYQGKFLKSIHNPLDPTDREKVFTIADGEGREK